MNDFVLPEIKDEMDSLNKIQKEIDELEIQESEKEPTIIDSNRLSLQD